MDDYSTDNVIPKGKNGDWYLKRGYYAGMS